MVTKDVSSIETTPVSKNGVSTDIQEKVLENKDTQTPIISTHNVASETKAEEGLQIEWNLSTYKEKYKILLMAHHELNKGKSMKLYEKYTDAMSQSCDLINDTKEWLDYYDYQIQEQNEKIENLKKELKENTNIEDENECENSLKSLDDKSKEDILMTSEVPTSSNPHVTKEHPKKFIYQTSIHHKLSDESNMNIMSSDHMLELPMIFIAGMNLLGFTFDAESELIASFNHADSGYHFILQSCTEKESLNHISYEVISTGSWESILPDYLKENITFDQGFLNLFSKIIKDVIKNN